jgi:hypothetical protein
MTRNSLYSPEPYRALENYFFRIVNTTPKEPTMFEIMKAKWTEFLTTQFKWIEEPATIEEVEPEDYWAFYARTSAYEDISAKETFIKGQQDGTWMEIVDEVLDVLSHHYGYNIKEQVYYSVSFPLNQEGCAGYGRSLNDEVLQKLLLSFPEVYETHGHIE